MDELREKYLQGKLTEAEQSAFEKGLSKKEKEELAFEVGVKDQLTTHFREELRNQIADFETRKSRGKVINWTSLSVAASFLLAASAVFYLFQINENLYDSFYQPYPNYELTTVRGETNLTIRQEAYRLYDQKKFAGAVDQFNKLDSLSPPDYFFRGMSYLETNKYESALSDFQQVIGSKNSAYINQSMWYAALVHIKLEDNASAITLLEDIMAGNSEYVTPAKKLLNQL